MNSSAMWLVSPFLGMNGGGRLAGSVWKLENRNGTALPSLQSTTPLPVCGCEFPQHQPRYDTCLILNRNLRQLYWIWNYFVAIIPNAFSYHVPAGGQVVGLLK